MYHPGGHSGEREHKRVLLALPSGRRERQGEAAQGEGDVLATWTEPKEAEYPSPIFSRRSSCSLLLSTLDSTWKLRVKWRRLPSPTSSDRSPSAVCP